MPNEHDRNGEPDHLYEFDASEKLSDDEGGNEDEDIGSEEVDATPYFPDFQNEIGESIQCLGGSVFPKLNWSSPKVNHFSRI